MTPEEVAALAPLPLDPDGTGLVRVRAQTEHVYAVETHLAAAGVPAERIGEHLLDLHRCPAFTPLTVWLDALAAAAARAEVPPE